MRLHRFFVAKLPKKGTKNVVITDKALLHQWKNVFRLKDGDVVILLDNSGQEFHATLESLIKTEAKLAVFDTKLAKNISSIDIYLLLAVLKKDNFEWVLEKGTELGVNHFVPILTDRTEKKNINQERGEKIIREAAEQSGRGRLPVLHQTMELKEAIKNINIPFIVFDPKGVPFGRERLKLPKIGILVGPEGGFSDREKELFEEYQIPVFSLGPGILRAETAAIVTVALVGLQN